jgi:hypothetical protein
MEKFKISSQEELDKINEDFYYNYPESKGLKFAGCNFYINRGNNWHEPIGTAQSMHDCEDCGKLNSCDLKKDNPTWFHK